YKVVTFEGGVLTLDRNKFYFKNPGAIAKLVIRFNMTGDEISKNLTSADPVDFVADIPKQTDRAEVLKRREVVSRNNLELAVLVFNCKKKPFTNPIFRRAVSMSIDRTDLVNAMTQPRTPFASVIPPTLFGSESNRGVRFDPTFALELLHHSGYSDPSKQGPLIL